MWLPTPIYEALPYLYTSAGIALIAGASYLGLDNGAAPVYLGAGAVSVLLGVLVYLRRAKARGGLSAAADEGEGAHAATGDSGAGAQETDSPAQHRAGDLAGDRNRATSC